MRITQHGVAVGCRSVPRGSPHFLQALTGAASIQLEHKQDPGAYVACYSQLAEQSEDHEVYRLLGAALMRVHQPEQAIKVRLCSLRFHIYDVSIATVAV